MQLAFTLNRRQREMKASWYRILNAEHGSEVNDLASWQTGIEFLGRSHSPPRLERRLDNISCSTV